MSEKKQSKSTQERHERLLNELLKVPGNEYCADCRAKSKYKYVFIIYICLFILIYFASIYYCLPLY